MEISCGDQLIGNTNFAFKSDEFNGCINENFNDVWYSITGDDKVHLLSSQTNSNNLAIDLYEGSCSQNFVECENDININDSEGYSFLAEAGVIYKIRV